MKRRTTSFWLLIISIYVFACNDTGTETIVQSKNTSDSTAVKDTARKYGDMKQYWLVFLLSGRNRNQDSAAAAQIQAAHMRNIERLADQGVIVMAGPMGYKPARELRGIFIMDAKDSATAASYIQTDSAVITGRLRFEIHPWWTAQGNYEFK